MKDLLAQNAFIDAREVVQESERPFVDADLTQHKDHGIDLQLAAEVFIKQYEGEDNFLRNLQGYLKRRGQLTQPQARAALNNWRTELRADMRPDEPVEIKLLDCFSCKEQFTSWDDLNAHKSQQHGKQAPPEVFSDNGQEAVAVLDVTTSIKGLDLSGLPDGRYAAPDPSGKNDNIFLMVKRVRVTKPRDRKYEAYGRVVSGNEIVVAGTIEVKEWSSNSKELVGEQKPNDVYRGKYEDQLELIMLMPEQFALLFGRLMGHCCRCGKKLTDQESRDIGLGLECEKKRNYFREPPKYTFIGQDRPDLEKVDPHDEDYLTKRLTRYIKPPVPATP